MGFGMGTDPDIKKVESRPDGWERFEKAVDAALHTPPKHRASERKSQGKATNERSPAK